MRCSTGSTIARASSGSRSRINSVEPLMSANSAVTVLRSPSIVRAASGHSAATRASEADSGVDAVAPPETALSISGAPHLPQKLEDGGFSALHFAHDLVRTFPHCAQKLLPGVLFVPHFVQRTGVPPTGRMALLYHRAPRSNSRNPPETFERFHTSHNINRAKPASFYRGRCRTSQRVHVLSLSLNSFTYSGDTTLKPAVVLGRCNPR